MSTKIKNKFEKSSQTVEGFRFVIFITGPWRSDDDDEEEDDNNDDDEV